MSSHMPLKRAPVAKHEKNPCAARVLEYGTWQGDTHSFFLLHEL